MAVINRWDKDAMQCYLQLHDKETVLEVATDFLDAESMKRFRRCRGRRKWRKMTHDQFEKNSVRLFIHLINLQERKRNESE